MKNADTFEFVLSVNTLKPCCIFVIILKKIH